MITGDVILSSLSLACPGKPPLNHPGRGDLLKISVGQPKQLVVFFMGE